MSISEMSVSGAVIIMAIAVIRPLAINRLPKKTFLALWGVALVRLLRSVSTGSIRQYGSCTPLPIVTS